LMEAARVSPKTEESDPYQNNATLELIDGVTGVDEEGRSRQRILTYVARRYSCLVLLFSDIPFSQSERQQLILMHNDVCSHSADMLYYHHRGAETEAGRAQGRYRS
ncbi:hypothetical protein Dimus_016399, partial [Dionaea muscipula]